MGQLRTVPRHLHHEHGHQGHCQPPIGRSEHICEEIGAVTLRATSPALCQVLNQIESGHLSGRGGKSFPLRSG
jgi:hypothetical protein